MRIPRFYVPVTLASGARLRLPESAFHHAVRVLRLRVGAELRVFNGQGGDYAAILEHIERRTAWVTIGDFSASERESPLMVTLLQGIARGERMDYSLQKAVELGVTRIQPLMCARSAGPLTHERLAKRMHHWHGVIIGACEQCGRNRLPELADPLTLRQWLVDKPDIGQGLQLDPAATVGLTALVTPSQQLSLLVGPEGGLDAAERAEATAAGFIGVQLGPRVLRTETAGIAALAAVQALWGDLG